MSNNGRFESSAAYIRAIREVSDEARLRVGLRVARLRSAKAYGAGIVPKLARDTGYRKSALYEYSAIASLMVRLYGFSARRKFEGPITWSHVREVYTLDDAEEILMALAHVERRLTTPDHFAVLVARWKGKPVAPRPLFDEQGPAHELVTMAARQMREWGTAPVRLTITRAK